ncbi:MAG: CDP-diacylglycerol--serine O-phosphatidyltransferase [Firmicutes bacterium]|nr:CDP-diacylglycerol--serine O-phosphatidyltransferase [Bacillota bacterium]
MSHGNRRESITGWFRKNIPNLLTLLNLLSGLSVLYLCIGKGEPDYHVFSCLFILMAAVLDALDGTLARVLGVQSDFGKQLDSLADLITFGVAPIAVLVTIEPIGATTALLCVLVLYPVAGAFRLARFNLGDYTTHFVGLPITAAGAIQACFALLITHYTFPLPWVAGSTALLTLLLSLLMASTFKISKYKVNRKK